MKQKVGKLKKKAVCKWRKMAKKEIIAAKLRQILQSHRSDLVGFDVTGTLEIERGKVGLDVLLEFKRKGVIVGIISNRVNHRPYKQILRSLNLDFYERGSIGKKEASMLKVASMFPNAKEKYYIADEEADKINAESAGWKCVLVPRRRRKGEK